MGLTEEQAVELIEHLRGTCMSLQEGTDSLFGLDEEYLSDTNRFVVDNEIFCCESCGWWGELNEQSEDGENCLDCFEE